MWTSPGPTPLPTGAVRTSGQVPGPRQSLAASAPPHALEAGPLTRHHEREVEALLHRLAVHLIGQCGEAHVLLVDVLAGAGGSGARWGSWGSPVPWPLPSSGQGAAGQSPQGGGISMAEVGEGLWAKALEVEGRWGWRVEAPARASQGPRWSLCACGGRWQAQRARRCPPLGGGQRAPGPRPLTHAQGPQRLEKPPPQYSPLPSVRGGRPRLAPIQPRGWLAAATAEQGLFIDSGAQPPAASGAHPRTPALRLPSHPQSVRGGRAHS